MTSATERLRALLDERGVKWEPVDGCAATYVEHNGEAWRFDYDEPFDQLGIVCLSGYTPEQAVAATLGPGTCHAVFEVDAMSEDERVGEFVCSECGETFRDGRDQRPNYCPNCGRKVADRAVREDGGGAVMFWHEMTKEQPTDNNVRYLLMGNGGGLYVGYLRANGTFHIPNNRSSYLSIKSIKAWAVIPEFGDQQ